MIAKKYDFENNVFHVKELYSNMNYPNFNYGLLFSKNESFPNAILEYLKLNLEVIAFDTGDVKKLIRKEGLIFNTRDPKSIAKKNKIYLNKKRKKNKSSYLKKILNPYQQDKVFLTLKNKIDKLCVES